MKTNTLTYLPLEPYKSRYTELSSCENGWFHSAFQKKFSTKILIPEDAAMSFQIKNGQVLDTVNRPLWALEQTKMLLEQHTEGNIYLDDFYHPGLDALAYSGLSDRCPISAFCWAQTFDLHDFTRGMPFMRQYERMAMDIILTTFVASPLLKEAIHVAFPDVDYTRVQVVGLPFDSANVRSLPDPNFQLERPLDVVFTSRFDSEKQPHFFLDVVEMLHKQYSFGICTGHDSLRGDPSAVARATQMQVEGKLRIHTNLSKPEYYSVLKQSRVQFNCSLQDWVSFTLLEALTFGCVPVYPNHRDFSLVFNRAPEYLYVPFDLGSAAEVVSFMLEHTPSFKDSPQLQNILTYHDGTIQRICNFL